MNSYHKPLQALNKALKNKLRALYVAISKALKISLKSPAKALIFGVSPTYVVLVLTLNFTLVEPLVGQSAIAESQSVYEKTVLRKYHLERIKELNTPRNLAIRMLSTYGWNEDEFLCLEPLWEKESNWNPLADNPRSSAYGIAQLLGETSDDPVSQMHNGMRYISDRYGTPCEAWKFWQKQKERRGTGWY